jgi:serine/threonine protein kinase
MAQSLPLPVRKATEIAVQVARGLSAAHDKGIVHRDVKPENIFILTDGRAKILDSGLARTATDTSSGTETGTEPGVVMGTVGYMAPEQVRAQTVDVRTDLFALGIVLHEMLSGVAYSSVIQRPRP